MKVQLQTLALKNPELQGKTKESLNTCRVLMSFQNDAQLLPVLKTENSWNVARGRTNNVTIVIKTK